MQPKYIHDCGECVFVGHENNNDYYVCPMRGKKVWIDFIERYGDLCEEYRSVVLPPYKSLQ